MEDEKVMICCIGKEENPYIREYVEHYKRIGATNICLFDNNDVDGERFEDVIGDYIESGFVILKDYRGRKTCQWAAYEECYDTYKDEYDWFAFFDCDEFLTFKNGHMTLQKYLSMPCFEDYDMIHVNWMSYGDNEKLYYEDKPLAERFTKPVTPYNFIVKFNFPENFHCKSIIRGYIDDIPIKWTRNSHTPTTVLACCDARGREIENSVSPFCDYDYSLAYLKHYTTKSLEEYCKKMTRGFPDKTPNDHKEHIDMAERYFRYNKKTDAKLELFKKLTGIEVSKGEPKNRMFYRTKNF